MKFLQKSSIALIILLPLLLTNCEKDNQTVSLWYLESKCGPAPWDAYVDFGKPTLVVDAVEQYLANDLSITEVEITYKFEASVAEQCEACSCKSGNVVEVLVNEEHVEALEEVGFEVRK
ncbi:MAG: hypothetical protein AAF960_17630 [Bacteroidota bacterium]